MSESDLQPVSVEHDGRVLTGVGVSVEQLEETMARHAPESSAPASPEVTPASGPAAAPAAEASADVPKTKGRARYSELTAERDTAKREREEAQRERDAIKAELEALKSRPAPEPAPAPPASTAVSAADPADEFEFPSYEEALAKYPTLDWNQWDRERLKAFAQWNTAHVTRQLNLDARISSSIEAVQASRQAADRLASIRTRGKAAYPDFDAVLQAPHVAQANWPLEKLQAIFELDTPEHVQYALAKDPALAERLRTEPNIVRFGMAIAQLIPAASGAAPASPGSTGSVIAPAPYQPVGSGSKTTVTPSAELAKKGFDFDASGYRERRAAERGVTRRR